MLIRFTVENFLSFKDRAAFSMLPGKGTLKKEHKADAVKGVRVLKAGVAFGANASGKSNLIKAIAFGKRLVLEGSMPNMPIEFSKFRLDISSAEKGSRLEYEIQAGGKNYAYGFILNNGSVSEEWLYEISKKCETKIFERLPDSFDASYLVGLQKTPDEKQFIQFLCKATPKNQLFLHEVMTRNVQGNVSNTTDLDNVLNWFLNTLTVIFPRDKYKSGIKLMAANDEQLKRYYTELLKYFDTGIKTICLQPVKENKTNIPESILEQIKMDLMKQKNDNAKISLTNGRDNYIFSLVDMKLHIQKLMTQHAINGSDKDAYFDIADESDGTNRIIDYIPLIIDLLKGDKVFVVDEIERSLHPNLIYDIFDLFLDNCENINSQLIVSTHESSLLTQKLLRKDEIWFVVKDRQGASALHSLEDYNVRFDKEIRKDYLLGRYRGVPRLGNRENLDSLIINKN
jgi:hypothetical protein